MRKRTGVLLKQSLAVMMSLSMAFGPCAPGVRPVFGAQTEAETGWEKEEETASASDASTASASDAQFDEDGFLVDGEVIEDAIPEIVPHVSSKAEKLEAMKAQSENDWYSDYEYELDHEAQTITLVKYKGAECDLNVPAVAEIDGKEYATVIENQGDYDGSVWAGMKDSLTSIAFGNGVILSGCAANLFSDFEKLEEIDISGLDTKNISSMEEMFRGCPSLKSIDLTGLDFGIVNYIDYMFQNCTGLESVDMSGLNTPNLWYAARLFENCTALKTVNMSGVEFSYISESDMAEGMLSDCSSLEEFYAPIGLTYEVELPYTMYDESGNAWTSIPQDLTESVLLRKVIHVTGVRINTTERTIEPGKTFQLAAWPQPSIATNKAVTWESSDESVATVDSTGKVKAEKTGSAVITVTTEDGGFTAACNITVKIPVTGVKINTEARMIGLGTTFQLAAWPQPSTATNKAVTWSSSDESVATVDSTGLVKAEKAGTATVTVTTVEGGYTASCLITVRSVVESGVCGENLTWAITEGQEYDTLIIEGHGAMEDYQPGEQPWKMFLEEIGRIQIEEGVTKIGDNAFSGIDHVRKAIVFPRSLQYLGNNVLDTIYVPMVFLGSAPARADLKAESTYYYPLNDPTWEKSLRWELAPKSFWIGYREGTSPWTDGIDEITTNVVRYSFNSNSKPFGAYVVVNEDGDSDLTLTILGPTSEMSLNAFQLQEYFFPAGIRTLVFGEQVTGTIGKQVFSLYHKLRGDLIIPDGVETIGTSAFELSGFDGKLVLPEGLKTVRNKAFYGCNFTGDLVIPDGIEFIEGEAFSGNRFTNLIYKGEYKGINEVALKSNPFQNVVFLGDAPSAVDSVHNMILLHSDFTYYYPENNPTWTEEVLHQLGNYQWIEWVPFEEGTEPWNGYTGVSGLSLGTDHISLREGTETVLSAAVLPEDADNKTVIWESEDPSIASVDQNGVVTAESCGTVTIRAMTWNRKYAAECRVLVYQVPGEGTCGQGVTWQLQKNGTDLTLKISGSGKMDDYDDYRGQPWSVYADEITRVEIGPGVRRVGKFAFSDFYWLSEVDIAEGVEEIGECSFEGGIHIDGELIIPASVKKIEKSAFCGCYGFNLLNIQDGLSVIGETAFMSCWDLEYLTLPASLTQIGERAFEGFEGDKVTYGGDWERLRNTAGFKHLPLDTVYCVYKDSFLPYSISEERVLIDLALDRDSITLAPGEEAVLNLSISPEIAADYPVSWKSENPQIAEIDNGILRGIKGGSTVVYAYTDDENNLASCTVTVICPVTEVRINTTARTMAPDATFQLKAWPQPVEAANRSVTWSSSDESVATVNSTGLVKALKTGAATITVTTVDGGLTATCKITVKVPVTGVKINTAARNIEQGKSFQLAAWPQPSNATNKSVTWTSSNTAVATVDSSGLVRGVKAGTATVTVKTADGGYTATCKITVKVPVIGVKINTTAKTIAPGKTFKLAAWPQPSTATNKSVTWTSSNTAVATVDGTGLVKAVKPGTATITVKTADGGYTATCKITANVAVTSVKINTTAKTMTAGSTFQLAAWPQPSNATNKAVTWTSSNTAVATVSSTGLVTAKKKGTATITVKTADGGKTATCKVTVN